MMQKHMIVISRWIIVCASLFVFHSVNATEKKDPSVCDRFSKDHRNQAVLIDKSTNRVASRLELGTLDTTSNKFENDYLQSPHQHRLILFPKHLKPESLCSHAACLKFRRATPRCPASAEFLVITGINPASFGPGKVDVDIDPELRIVDPKSDFPEATDVVYSFTKKLTGTLEMPWIVLDDKEVSDTAWEKFFSGRSMSIEMKLVNKGSRSQKIFRWVPESNEPEIRVENNSCLENTLEPQNNCRFTLVRNQAKPLVKKSHQWVIESSDSAPLTILSVEWLGDGTIRAAILHK